MNAYSRFYSEFQLSALEKVGNVLIPGSSGLPRFSEAGVLDGIDRVAAYMTESDRSGLGALLFALGWLPGWAVRFLLLFWFALGRRLGRWGAPFRMVEFGLKGVVYTLYYSGIDRQQSVLKRIGYDAAVRSERANEEGEVMSAAQVFQTAEGAAPAVASMSVRERLKFVARLKEVVLREREACIDELQRATGKGRSDALFSEIFPILDSLDYLERFAEEALKPVQEHTPLALLGKKSRILYEPLGPVLVISPWNYPLFQAIVPIMNAFVAGNSVVYKPSELTPLRGLVERLLNRAGFNPHWVQVVYGDGAFGSELIDARPKKIFFTGSVATGKVIMAQAARHLIPVELELGGKDPMVVFEDANIARAAAGAVWGAFTNAGQSCTSVEWLYVHREIYSAFRTELLKQVAELKVGDTTTGDVDYGRMTSAAQIAKVRDLLEDALAKGAVQLSGQDWDRKSALVPPIVLEGVAPGMLISDEEIFGPLLPICSFDDETVLLQEINASPYGLSASVWSADSKRALRVARAIQTGNVSINNVMLTEGNPALPFGGVKNSGVGRFKGRMGLQAFSNVKSLIIDSNSSKIEVNWYPYTAQKYRLFDRFTVSLFGRKGLRRLLGFAYWGLRLESISGKARRSRP